MDEVKSERRWRIKLFLIFCFICMLFIALYADIVGIKLDNFKWVSGMFSGMATLLLTIDLATKSGGGFK